jgi:DNA mismatch repair protein MSH6
MAIAAAVLHQLATHTLPLSFFATHYGSLADDFAYHPNIRNMHMSTVVDEERREVRIRFSNLVLRFLCGVSPSSFSCTNLLTVLRLAPLALTLQS